MKALATIESPFGNFIQGLTGQDIIIQAGLAQELLYGLGMSISETAPPIGERESLQDYIKRLDDSDLATIEALGIGQGRQMESALRAASRIILYHQYVSGRWQHYADKMDVGTWSPYVTHILDDCLNVSEASGRRTAIAIEVIASLYWVSAKERLGLIFLGDPIVDGATGEVTEAQEGLPRSPEEALLEYFGRYAREAGVKLRDLLRQLDNLPITYWTRLIEYQQLGYLGDEKLAYEKLRWDIKDYESHRALYDTVLEVRRILELASSPVLSDKEVNRQATGGKSTMPAWVLPEDVPPAWASYLEAQFPGTVSATGSLALGKRLVQVRRIDWPQCKDCVGAMAVGPDGPFCTACGYDPVSKKTIAKWSMREADENSRYPKTWESTERPEWKLGVAESMDIHGLKVSVWEIALDLDEL